MGNYCERESLKIFGFSLQLVTQGVPWEQRYLFGIVTSVMNDQHQRDAIGSKKVSASAPQTTALRGRWVSRESREVFFTSFSSIVGSQRSVHERFERGCELLRVYDAGMSATISSVVTAIERHRSLGAAR